MNYAILKAGTKQYKVKTGDVIDIEKLPVEEGSWTELKEVLAVSRDDELIIGRPLVPEASVLAHVQSHGRDAKIIVFKYKRKVRYRRKKGHRQHYTRLVISGIFIGDEEIDLKKEPLVEEPSDGVEPEPDQEPATQPTDQAEDQSAHETPQEPVDQEEDASTEEDSSEPETGTIGDLQEESSSEAGVKQDEDAPGEIVPDQAVAKPKAKRRSTARKSPAKKSPKAEAKDNGP